MGVLDLLFSFRGRINRWHYWAGALPHSAFVTVALILLAPARTEGFTTSTTAAALALAFVSGWILLSLSIKRFHDRNKSGWWVLVAGIPQLGQLWLLVENGFLAGDDEENRFGPPDIWVPKYFQTAPYAE